MNSPETWQPGHPAMRELLAALLQQAAPVYAVGGTVRDHLLDRDHPDTDLDLVAASPVLPLARRLADRLGWAFYALDQERDVARLVYRPRDSGRGDAVPADRQALARHAPLVCDIAGLRGMDVGDDLRSRDFTVNALALRLVPGQPPQLMDPCNGRADLSARLLRTVSEHSLSDDPLRLLRAVRLAAQLDFTIEPEVRRQIRHQAAAICQPSAERVRDELWKTMATDRPQAAVEVLRELDLLGYTLPEVAATVDVAQSPPHYLDVYRHTLVTVGYASWLREWAGQEMPTASLDAGLSAVLEPWHAPLCRHLQTILAADRPRGDWLIWAALLHDVGKPVSRSEERQPDGSRRYRFFGHERLGAEMAAQRLDALQFGRREIGLIRTVVGAHMRPHLLHTGFGSSPISRRACHRFFRDTAMRSSAQDGTAAQVGIDVLLLALADYQATYAVLDQDWEHYLVHVQQLLDHLLARAGASPRPLVDGHALMEQFHLQPGPQIGRLLSRLQEAQAVGEVQSVDEAMAVISRWLHEDSSRGQEQPQR